MTERNRTASWDSMYKDTDVERMPWFSEDLDPDLEQELQERNIATGTFLDLCTGPGTQAIALSGKGFTVTGTDISESAVEKAKKLSSSVEFKTNDILNSTLRRKFDYIFDRGCFHVFSPEERLKYLREVKRMLKRKGLLFLKCFSVKEKGDKGPYRFSGDEIEEIFSRDFVIESIRDTRYQGTLKRLPKALFIVMRKR